MSAPDSSGRAGVRRMLYLDGYTVTSKRTAPSGTMPSDSIGYGITASTAISRTLGTAGWDVARPEIAVPTDDDERATRLRWLLSSYQGVLEALTTSPPDVIFAFHAFSTFPVEIRRMLLDLELKLPLVGYTHGSHWDPTDTYRVQAYPGMELLDLANLHVLDRVLLVSEYMRTTLRSTIAAFNEPLGKALDAKCEVVGLPLDVELINNHRTDERPARTTLVFNHAPVASKNPQLFVRVMRRILPRHDVQVLFTRRYPAALSDWSGVASLAVDFPDQVKLGDDLPLSDYYRALWMADIQVSTATHESLGVSTLEAMHTGTCCILPRLGSYPEITGDHPDVLYDLGAGQLEERLTYFLEHPEQRWAVASDLQRAAARYRPAVVVQRIADVLDSL